MTKRGKKFKRNPRDYYRTPYSAVIPLLPHLLPGTTFDEPMAGDGALVTHLQSAGHLCYFATDIEPQQNEHGYNILEGDVFELPIRSGEMFITNPPWRRDLLHQLIPHLSEMAPTWLLLDADWMHTKQAAPYLKRCRKIVSVGRVSWMENNVSGFDNCAWYLFGNEMVDYTKFYGRE